MPLAGRAHRGAGRRRPARQPGRRDARGAIDRGAGQGEASACAAREMRELGATFIPFTAQTRMSGCDSRRAPIRKGAVDAIAQVRRGARRHVPARVRRTIATGIGDAGGTPLAVADGARVLGVMHLKDVVKGGISGALRALPRDGDPHGDDHRRQPAHRRHDRRARRASTTSSPRRRPKTKMQLIKERAGQGQARRDDRRRHERRARAGAGRRRPSEPNAPGGRCRSSASAR